MANFATRKQCSQCVYEYTVWCFVFITLGLVTPAIGLCSVSCVSNIEILVNMSSALSNIEILVNTGMSSAFSNIEILVNTGMSSAFSNIEILVNMSSAFSMPVLEDTLH